jgi:hypothetical protein
MHCPRKTNGMGPHQKNVVSHMTAMARNQPRHDTRGRLPITPQEQNCTQPRKTKHAPYTQRESNPMTTANYPVRSSPPGVGAKMQASDTKKTLNKQEIRKRWNQVINKRLTTD